MIGPPTISECGLIASSRSSRVGTVHIPMQSTLVIAISISRHDLRTSYSPVHTKFACLVYRNIFAIILRERFALSSHISIYIASTFVSIVLFRVELLGSAIANGQCQGY